MMRGLLSDGLSTGYLCLAQIADLSADGIGKWLIGLAAVAVIVNQVAGAMQKLRGKPVGLEIQESQRLMQGGIESRIEDLERQADRDRLAVDGRLVGLSAKVDRTTNELRIELQGIRASVDKKHEGIVENYQAVLKSLSRIEGRLENQHG